MDLSPPVQGEHVTYLLLIGSYFTDFTCTRVLLSSLVICYLLSQSCTLQIAGGSMVAEKGRTNTNSVVALAFTLWLLHSRCGFFFIVA